MIVKKIIITSLLICTVSFLKAQTFSLSWGEERKIKVKYQFDTPIQLNDGSTVVVKLKQRTNSYGTYYIPNLILMDTAMEEVKENEVKFDEKNTVILGFEKRNSSLFFIYTAYNMDDKKTTVYGLKIDETSLKPSSKIILGSYTSINMQNQVDVSYKISTDSSKLLLFVEDTESRKQKKKLFISIFDTDLNKIWSRDISLSMQERYVSIYDKDVTDDGKVFVAIKHYEKEVTRQAMVEKGTFTPSYIYKLLIFSNDAASDRELAFNLNNKFIQKSKIIYKNGMITAAGLYKKLPYNYSSLTGIFYTQFNVNDTIVKEPVMIEFPKELIDRVKKDHFADNGKEDPGLDNSFKITDIISRADGSVDLVSEYQTFYNNSAASYGLIGAGVSMSLGLGGSGTNYIYGDVVNTHIDINGGVNFTRIPKNQRSQSEDLLSYFPLIYQDKLILVFNDDKDNVDKDLDKRPDRISNMGRSVVVAATISSDGELSRQIIYDSETENFALIPRSSKKISETSYFIKTRLIDLLRSRQRFGVLSIQ